MVGAFLLLSGAVASGELQAAVGIAGRIVFWWTLVSIGTATLWSLVLRGIVRRTADSRHGHLARGGSDISTASGLCPVSSPNFVPRS